MATIYVQNTETLPSRRQADFYPTERTLIQAVLAAHRPPVATSVLDVGAGDGRWGQIARCHYTKARITGVELRSLPQPAGFNAWHSGVDFLTWQPESTFDLILSNPPYGDGQKPPLAERMLRHAWPMLTPGGWILFLLPLDFQTSTSRFNDLWRTHSPVRVVVLARRPSFYGGGTAGTNFAVYIWHKNQAGQNAATPHQWQVDLLNYERDDTRVEPATTPQPVKAPQVRQPALMN